jgi:beta-glucosidase
MKKSKLWLGLAGVGVLLTTTLIAGTQVALDNEMLINDVLGLSRTNLAESNRSDYAEADGSLTDTGYRKMIADSYKFCVEEEEQGSVLFKNDNDVLPLEAGERNVTLFGRNSAHLMHRSGAGGAAPNEKLVVHLDDAFQECGFNINKTVWNLYTSGGNQSVTGNSEIAVSNYTDSVKDSFKDYSDAAIITFTRFGTEDTDPSNGILDLQTNEKELLKMVKAEKDKGTFRKVIVLLNSPSAMGLEFADNPDYGVDAVIWFGIPGYYSLTGLVHVLTGEANPSGHAPETFAKYSTSSAAYQNFGTKTLSGGNVGGQNSGDFVAYKEGIYVGYKYYETRYEDAVLGQGNATVNKGIYAGTSSWDYAAEMGYPFGWGMSYTEFEQKITGVTYNAEKDEFEVKVNVKNVGDREGRASVQVYFQQPYTDWDKTNLLEKSAICLGGYDKVLLKKGESKDVTVTFDKYFLCSYDAGKGTTRPGKHYFIEEGDYYFAIGNGAHEALNNIIALKDSSASLVDHNGEAYSAPANTAVKMELQADEETYQKSHYDKDVDVVNQFDNADLNYWASDSNKITYLTRQDWNTFPTTLSSFTATDAMKAEINNNGRHVVTDREYYTNGNGTNFNVRLKSTVVDEETGEEKEVDRRITFSDMAGVPFSGKFTDKDGNEQDADQLWDEFISQMSVNDLAISMSDARGLLAVPRISKPSNSVAEGPEGLLAQFNYGDKRWATGFATGPVYSATWDHEMQKKFGGFYGEEALFCGAASVNAPGTNILRTPYGSRASEYMSEDGIFNYYIASNVVKEALRKGLVMNIKHCFLNNQESGRHGINTFANEQSIREIYLKPFEGALTRGGGMGIMTSYNRIGCTYAAVHKNLMMNVMRGEWAYKGLIIDDAQTGSNDSNYANGPLMVEAGTNVFCLDSNRGSQLVSYVTSNNDGGLVKKMQESNKYIMYALLKSFMGDMSAEAAEADMGRTQNVWWKNVLYGADIGFGVLTLAAAGLFVVFEFFKKAKKNPEAEEPAEAKEAE